MYFLNIEEYNWKMILKCISIIIATLAIIIIFDMCLEGRCSGESQEATQ